MTTTDFVHFPRIHDRADQLVTEAAKRAPTRPIGEQLLIARATALDTMDDWIAKGQITVAAVWSDIVAELRHRHNAHQAVTA